jgi:hypothetical protein
MSSETGRRYSKELLRLSRKHFPHLVDELQGIAEGAGVHFNAVWAMTIKSELGALTDEMPGCSTVYVGSKQRQWLFHNEDGNAAYADLMFVVRVSPPSGVNFVSLVYPGILTGNGPSMNSRGVIQTTNYIGSTRAEMGLPRYVLGRAILEAASLEEAQQIATLEPRAYPYHHNLAGVKERSYRSLETVPGKVAEEEPKGVFVHTNHLLHRRTRRYSYQDEVYRESSSMSRYEVLQTLAEDAEIGELGPETVLDWLSSHQRKPYSPCRHPQGEIRGQTLATAFFDIRTGSFRLYKGNPCTATYLGAYMDLDKRL